MILKNTKYSFFIAFLAVIGLFSSLVHYHSDGLDCLDHAEEAHIIQNDNFCPICTLVGRTNFVPISELKAFLTPEGVVIDSYAQLASNPVAPSLKGRSPPSLA